MAEKLIASLYDLLRQQFGVELDIAENREVSSVGTSDVIIARNDPRRVVLIIVNLSTNILYIRPKQAASTTVGIRLGGSGGWRAIGWREDFIMPALEWHGIASGAASAVYILEGIVGKGVVSR